MLNHKRLSVARKRRQLTGKGLAERADLSAVTISRIENGETPDEETIKKIARALDYPIEFFSGDDLEELDVNTVSFRSLTKMKAHERDAAITAGTLGLELNDWIESQFSLPAVNIIDDLSYETNPAIAAKSLREFWGLGEKPIGNMLGLLEVNGIRVFSLSENTANVDAFSFWKGEKPFIFLNNFKTAEHSIFDAAHELGHLVLHRHGDIKPARAAEREANLFASSFLMPENDVRARMSRFITVDSIIAAKRRWRVSAMAMAYRLHNLGLLSEWQYKSACIELGRRGYRSGEPDGIERETSRIWQKILAQLWSERKTKANIADTLKIPLDELEALIWSLTAHSPNKPNRTNARDSLHLIE